MTKLNTVFDGEARDPGNKKQLTEDMNIRLEPNWIGWFKYGLTLAFRISSLLFPSRMGATPQIAKIKTVLQ